MPRRACCVHMSLSLSLLNIYYILYWGTVSKVLYDSLCVCECKNTFETCENGGKKLSPVSGPRRARGAGALDYSYSTVQERLHMLSTKTKLLSSAAFFLHGDIYPLLPGSSLDPLSTHSILYACWLGAAVARPLVQLGGDWCFAPQPHLDICHDRHRRASSAHFHTIPMLSGTCQMALV